MPGRPCLVCGKLGRGSYCRRHDRRAATYKAKRGSGWAQSRFREVVLAQARGRCQRCGATSVPLEAHHVVSVAKGGTHSPRNGIALCPSCHRAAT